jgi:hypothetical protein
MPDGASAESEPSEAGGIGGSGPFPTMVGNSFENLLRGLGYPPRPTPPAPATEPSRRGTRRPRQPRLRIAHRSGNVGFPSVVRR